jgi:hypothetical protein
MIARLSNVVVYPHMSEETTAFSAALDVDGIEFEVKNRGQGGCHDIHPRTREGYAILRDQSLEDAVSCLLHKFLTGEEPEGDVEELARYFRNLVDEYIREELPEWESLLTPELKEQLA